MSEKTVKTGFDFYSSILILVVLSAAFLDYPYLFTSSILSDEGLYCWFGKQISLHPSFILSHEITSWHPPLFSVFLALAHGVSPSFMSYHCVAFLFYLTGIIVVYCLGEQLSNPFVGALAAIILAFDPSYFFISTRILIDIPLMVFCTILAIFLFRIKETSPLKDHFLVGIWGALTILLKWSGIMIAPWVLFYYLSSLPKLSLKNRINKFLIPFSVIFTVILLLCIKNYIQLGRIQPYGPPINGSGYMHGGDNLIKLFNLIFPLFYIFFIFGVRYLFFKREKPFFLLLTWIIVFALCIFSINDNDQRFNILILPAILITIGIGIDNILDFLKKRSVRLKLLKPVVTIVVFVFCLQILSLNLPLIIVEHSKFTGYEQAGTYIQKAATHDTLVLAGSERQVRYFSGIDLKDYGGQIVPFRQSMPEFKKLVQQTPGPIILEIDMWENLQPAWTFSRAAKKELAQDGFKLTRVVLDHLRINGKTKRFPVIFIYERPARPDLFHS